MAFDAPSSGHQNPAPKCTLPSIVGPNAFHQIRHNRKDNANSYSVDHERKKNKYDCTVFAHTLVSIDMVLNARTNEQMIVCDVCSDEFVNIWVARS